ncbi:hypothetical protein BSPLISOX_1942 [uncultured Gammaproteobacteria bacterium]|jgi:hypothetical protein|nr:hypothetical protein [uncultured Gammaproteobacteria bacterium]CAC9440655.1 hypothetical protein [uncultured Gammaproteobacteria bacterium]VVH65709.1 hypothetical protein BSPLISOX_1942 [uncultured Gammaproteobacteria bacterium]
MLRLPNVNLTKHPDLIQPPNLDDNDNIAVIRLVSDKKEIIHADIIDVALSYSISGIDVVLEVPFKDKNSFDNKKLASLVSNGGWSISLLPPSQSKGVLVKEYCDHIIEWYQQWRSKTMTNFEKSIYPITPYIEYLTTNYLIKQNRHLLDNKETQELEKLSKNPTDKYLVELIDNMNTDFIDAFKKQLEQYINQEDSAFYKDIDLLTSQYNE